MYIYVEAERGNYGNPDMKQEGGTYVWPTATALEGMLKSVYWHGKPNVVNYKINRVKILNPVQTETISTRQMNDRLHCFGGKEPKQMDSTLRATTYIVNLAYAIDFEIYLTDESQNPVTNKLQMDKVLSILSRRIKHGTYYTTPYLGKRECIVEGMKQITKEEFEALNSCYKLDSNICGGIEISCKNMVCGMAYNKKGGAKSLRGTVTMDEEGVLHYPDMRERVRQAVALYGQHNQSKDICPSEDKVQQ